MTPRALAKSPLIKTPRVGRMTMRTTIHIMLLFSGCAALLGQAQPSSTPVESPRNSSSKPSATLAARQLAALLEAINSGEIETIRRYVAEHFEKPPQRELPIDPIAQRYLALNRSSRGLVLRKIVAQSATEITALVQSQFTEAWMQIQIFLSSTSDQEQNSNRLPKIKGIGIQDVEIPVELLPQQKLSEREIQAKLDGLMTKLVVADQFSGVVYVAKNGVPFYASAFGIANRTWSIPNRIDTRFNLASITKMFTAVAVAQLVEQKKFSYEDTVGKILPNYPNKEVAQKVTLHHLLSHTSGLIGGRALAEREPQTHTARTINEMIKPFELDPLSFPPGQQFDYSNAGFILIGALIEKASGQNYFDYVRDHIFKPAGMVNTDFYELDSDPQNLANGYKDGPNGTRLNNIFDLEVKGSPAAMAYSTGEDLTRFHMALIHHKLIKAASLKTLWSGVTEQPNGRTEYGYGTQIDHYNGFEIIGHGGGWKGITNEFEFYPQLGYTVVILSNYDNETGGVARKLREWLTQGLATQQPTPEALPSLAMKAEAQRQTTAVGTPIAITVHVKNEGGTAHASVINMEVKNGSGVKVHQQFTTGQKIEAGQSRTYHYSWTPSLAGKFMLEVGAFGPSWQPKLSHESNVTTLRVLIPTPAPASP